jgi:hypothetical protein
MKTVDDVRRENLSRIVLTAGGVGKVAEQISRSASQVSQWLNGSLNSATGKPRGMSGASCRQIELAYNKQVGWMDVDHGANPAENAPGMEIDLFNNPEYPAIRRVSLRLSAGMTGFVVEHEEDDGEMIVFKRGWYDRNGYIPEKLIAIKVKGQSMEPGLFDGDTVVVNTNDTKPKDGEVFAVNYEGEAVIKRLERDMNQWFLSSDNPDKARYARKRCEGGSCIIIGRIVHKQSERI